MRKAFEDQRTTREMLTADEDEASAGATSNYLTALPAFVERTDWDACREGRRRNVDNKPVENSIGRKGRHSANRAHIVKVFDVKDDVEIERELACKGGPEEAEPMK